MITVPQLDQYKDLIGEDQLSQIYDKVRALSGLHVMHFNTTERGGGVAEILQSLLPLLEDLGIKHTWKVVPLDDTSNHFTAHLVDMLQGNIPGQLEAEDQQAFLDTLAQTPILSRPQDSQADLYFVHDFQLAPLTTLFPWLRPAIWFCHIDTANPNQYAKEYILRFLNNYNVCAFNSQASVFKELPREHVQVITLGIDPFKNKNKYITREQGMQAIARCGVDPTRPLITQVSRFGRWKNPWQVVDIYRLVKQHIPNVQVALVGAMEAADDIEANDVLADLRKYAKGDPDIHLLHDPTMIRDQEVNAFQRYSSVILQRSSREGFGLTATEAMWKEQPVIGTSSTGLRSQIIHEQTGYIVDDTQTSADYTLKLLQDRDLWRKLGQQAHEHVRKNFLFPMIVLGYLDALTKAMAFAHAQPNLSGGQKR
ncbi:glycosyltransferase [Ktedonosporobacter rubrisoli]|uniref:Glycosyltransferase n=1 Tax=Ktedonosporobacter rubrisoli TaxID=2509675 RepID=A0A4P6JTR6_KTERU|nr:glycosyltransferase [Ktedonosporobacter rubrisoli]QBD78713.1 glycosyltransferase [Ktedonosporobacter rubrisoli]